MGTLAMYVMYVCNHPKKTVIEKALGPNFLLRYCLLAKVSKMIKSILHSKLSYIKNISLSKYKRHARIFNYLLKLFLVSSNFFCCCCHQSNLIW